MRTPNDHQRYLIEEFVEAYQERRMTRRELLRRSFLATGSLAMTATTLVILGCGSDDSEPEPSSGEATSPPAPSAEAGATTAPESTAPSGEPEDDSAVEASDITFAGPTGEIFAYLARPAAEGPYPGVLIIHENRGLLPHFKDVARRYASEGFVGLAVDLASRLGGSDTAAESLGQIPPVDLVADLQAGLDHLKQQDFVRADALGVSGFCFGGGYTFDMAAASPDIKAAVPYYGTARRAISMGLAETQAAVLVMYGETDSRITGEQDDVRATLEQAGVPFEIMVHQGAGHAFFNDTGSRYDPAAADAAWTATLAWFREYLGV
jgi:carboxymethylenebutenolidase